MKYLIKFRLGKSVFERAIDPRFYIEDLRELGSADVKVLKENIPGPEEEPTDNHCFHADVVLETDRGKDEILEILEFIIDDGVEIEVIEGRADYEERGREIKEKESGFEVPETLLENYKLETEEILSRLRQSLQDLHSDPSNLDLINEVFRSFHTLKGNTGLILTYGEEPNLKYLHEVTHRSESVLQKARDTGAGLSQSQVELLQEILDKIDDLFLAFVESRVEEAEDVIDLLERLEKGGLEGGSDTGQIPSEIGAVLNVWNQYSSLFKEISKKENLNKEEEEFFKRSLTTLYKVLKEAGFENLKRQILELANSIGNVDFGEFKSRLDEFAKELDQELKKFTKAKTPKKIEKSKEIDTSRYIAKTNYLKVEESLVSEIMDVVGELSVFKEWISLFSMKLSRVYEVPEASKELKDHIHRFRGLVDTLQRQVLDMRMVPVSVLFERFPKLVRDLSRSLGKKVDLVIEGGDTKLDKVIVEKIAEPMIHLIRNAIDHGIETVEERREIGKSETAQVKIIAYQEGGSVIIEVSDDGRGIDAEKIKKKAIEKGLYTEEELSRMNEDQILGIIFQSGFSTKEQATELSGRGVGMDVVARTIRDLGGNVNLTTERGLGTTVRLSLPLTLAIRKILLVKVGNMTFGLPAESVGEVIKVSRDMIKKSRGRYVFYHRDNVLYLDFLSNRLGIKSSANGVITVLIDNYLSNAIAVDDVISTIDTVVKPVPEFLDASDEISGITILGDGSIVYILEVLK